MNDSSPRAYPGETARFPTLREILTPVCRRWRLVVLSFAAILAGVVLSAVILPRQYQAQMKILVKRDRGDSALVPVRGDVTEEELNSEVELLKSRDLLEKVVLACGLHHVRDKSFWSSVLADLGVTSTGNQTAQRNELPNAVRALEQKLHIELLRKTSLIRVTYESTAPARSAKVLTTLANLYLEKHLGVHRAPGVFDFLQRETQRYEKELGLAETRLTDFDKQAGVVAAPLEKEITLHKLTDFDATLQGTQVAVAETEKRIGGLESQLAKTPIRRTTQIRKSDNAGLLAQLKSTLLNLELRRTELLGKFASDYPPVKELGKQIGQTRAAIDSAEGIQVYEETSDLDPTREWMRAELARSKTELAVLHARAVATSRVVHAYADRARLIDDQGILQQKLLRAAKAAEENYFLYLHKQEEARISDALDRQRIVNVVIAEPPVAPAVPSRPGWALTFIAGGIVAGIVSLGSAYARDYWDPSFRTPDELERFLNLPALAAMPKNG